MSNNNAIVVCECKIGKLYKQISAMGYDCIHTNTDMLSIMKSILSFKPSACVIDADAVSADDLTELIGILSHNEEKNIFIAVGDQCVPHNSDPSYLHFMKELPCADEFRRIIGKSTVDRYAVSLSYAHNNRTGFNTEITEMSGTDELERDVTEIIRKFGIPANIKGYRYLRSAVMLATRDITILDSITKLLYPAVAKSNGTTPTRVERAIRHAISSAWDRGNGDVEYIESKLNYKVNFYGTRPTNSELIALISDCMRLKACF